MSVQANSEQRMAIEHQGGVLLSAGAGSGKTFVLKEHFLYLCEAWIHEHIENPMIDFNSFVKSKLRKLVFMTFTNKAAGELELRIKGAVELKLEICTEQHKSFWLAIKSNIDFMTIGTIHGFCLKLIRQGFFPDLPAEVNIKSENEFRKFLNDLLDQWFIKSKTLDFDFELQVMLKNKDKIIDALFTIFSDAAIRKMWMETEVDNLFSNESINNLMNDIFVELNFNRIWDEPLSLSELNEYSGKKWCDFLCEFLALVENQAGYLELFTYLSERSFKIPAKPSGKTISPQIVSYYESVRDFKDWLKKNGDSLTAFNEQRATSVKSWYGVLSDLVFFVESQYYRFEGVTFADLEYMVFNGLKDKGVVANISNEYTYFVVDEFQDTSQIQFSIIETILNRDYRRLFCVGDPKQAIYGFRGGELGVFLNCMKNIPSNLSLKNNYRSQSAVIEYNNYFFDFLFAKGVGFKGEDQNSVEVLHQELPDAEVRGGEVVELQLDLSFIDIEEKISNFQVDYLEAMGIFHKIRKISADGDNCAVLYKRLKPSYLLIDKLIKENIGFTAQVKIPFLDDPINGLFNTLLLYLRDTANQKDLYSIYLINSYIQVINIEKAMSINIKDLDRFVNNVKYFGIFYSFCNFLEQINISNSNFSQNLSVIEAAIKSCDYDIDQLIIYFEKLKVNTYSLDFQYGENPESVIIMTAHASKGLQFQHVILGGIYTNGASIPNRGPVGKLPGSFRWTDQIQGKKQFKTPAFILEDIINKKKEFSESKRLFYVANTRAEESLSYVNLNFNSLKRSRSQADAWISGILTWGSEANNFKKDIQIELVNFSSDEIIELSTNRTPFFHQDNLGIILDQAGRNTVLLPELSVTRLATLASCARKFYLENICKFSDEDILELKNSFGEIETKKEEFDSQLTLPSISSSDRGTRIHYELSQVLDSGLDKSFIKSPEINWVVENLQNYLENYKFVSEKQIKFDLFSYMISGIPDLILLSETDMYDAEIWDFKTGRLDKEKEGPYRFQLFCYAYGLYSLEKVSLEKCINLVLCYVDEEIKVEENVSFKDVENFLHTYLLDINSPEKENLAHCQNCNYRVICQK